MSQHSRLDRHAGKIFAGLWAVTMIAGLAALEWALAPADGRFSGDAQDFGRSPSRTLVLREWGRNTDYLMAPTEERKRHSSADLPKVYKLEIDAQGFIEPARRHADPDVTIVFLGGSTTECLYVAPQNRFPALVARKLEAELGLKINGLNGARSGNNSMHSLLLLLGKVIPLEPDFVVLNHAANDIGILTAKGTYWTDRGSTRLVENEEITAEAGVRILLQSLTPNTSQLVSRAWGRLKRMLRSAPARAATPAHGPRNEEEMGRQFARALTSSVRLAQAWGITPVLLTQVHVRAGTPAERKSDFLDRERLAGTALKRGDYPSAHAYFNALTRQVAARTGAMLIDLASARTWRYGDVYDGLHFTDQGSRLAADIIAADLRDAIRARAAR